MRKVLQQLKQYKRDTFLCIAMSALEVLMEILLPAITARIIDQGLEAANLPAVFRYGILLIVMAFLGLVFGTLAGKFAASASAGIITVSIHTAISSANPFFSFRYESRYIITSALQPAKIL